MHFYTFLNLLCSHQMTREVQYGQLNLFKTVDPDLMSVNMLLKKSMFCKQVLRKSIAGKMDSN